MSVTIFPAGMSAETRNSSGETVSTILVGLQEARDTLANIKSRTTSIKEVLYGPTPQVVSDQNKEKRGGGIFESQAEILCEINDLANNIRNDVSSFECKLLMNQ